MSTRIAEKQRRKAERLAAERQAAARDTRRRRMRLAGGGLAAIVLAGAIAAAIALSGGEADTTGGVATDARGRALAPGEVAGAFGQHYTGLEARRTGAGVTTMMDTMNSPVHFHPKLTILADGKPVAVPANIGIDPRQDAMRMASLHTHEEPGIIHVEGQENATLGQFFAVWGVPLSADRLGAYREPVRMWVDGRRSEAFGRLRLADGQNIILAVGRGGPR